MKDPANSVFTSLYNTLNGNVKSKSTADKINELFAVNGFASLSQTCEDTLISQIFESPETSTALNVYSVMPDNVGAGYVYIDDFQYSEEDLKDRFYHFGNINIQVVVPQSDPNGSLRILNEYCESVLNLIKPNVSSTLDLAPFFNNTYLYSTNIGLLIDNFDDGRTQRRVIRLTLGIEEL